MTTETRWPHLIGEDGNKAVEILQDEGMEPRLLLPGMRSLSHNDAENPKFISIHVDDDNKVVHLSK